MHPSALASHGPSNVHCKPSLDIYRNPQWHTFSVFSFFHCLLCPLCLCRMGQAMSTATRLWIFIAALSSTRFRCTYVARITSYDHPLLYRSKQLRRTDSKVDTTCVACCTFPFFCLFFYYHNEQSRQPLCRAAGHAQLNGLSMYLSTTASATPRQSCMRYRSRVRIFFPRQDFWASPYLCCATAVLQVTHFARSSVVGCGMTRVTLTAAMHSPQLPR